MLDPYHEHRDVEMRGQLLRPAGLPTDRITVSLFPSTHLLEERRKDLKPIAVGSIESCPDRLDGRLSIPSDMLPSVLQVLAAGRLKYLVMRGSKFRYRSARLVSFSLGSRLDEEDEVAVSDATGIAP